MPKPGGSALALALLLGACATRPIATETPGYSLVGSWAYVDPQPDASSPRAGEECETDFGVRYRAEGTFTGYEEAGTWRIVDGDLVETITRTWEMGVDGDTKVANPSPSRIRLEWKSADVVNLLGVEQDRGYGLVRCRAPAAR